MILVTRTITILRMRKTIPLDRVLSLRLRRHMACHRHHHQRHQFTRRDRLKSMVTQLPIGDQLTRRRRTKCTRILMPIIRLWLVREHQCPIIRRRQWARILLNNILIMAEVIHTHLPNNLRIQQPRRSNSRSSPRLLRSRSLDARHLIRNLATHLLLTITMLAMAALSQRTMLHHHRQVHSRVILIILATLTPAIRKDTHRQ